jgi:hypothetical protein
MYTKFLVEKLKESICRPRLGMEKNIKMDVKEIMWVGVDGVIWLWIGFCGVFL